jgi:hypothetical protein
MGAIRDTMKGLVRSTVVTRNRDDLRPGLQMTTSGPRARWPAAVHRPGSQREGVVLSGAALREKFANLRNEIDRDFHRRMRDRFV